MLILPLHIVYVFLNGAVLFIHKLYVLGSVFQNLSTRRLQTDQA